MNWAAGAEFAAEGAPLVSDRPDFTESSVSVPRGRVQIESGATFERSGESRTQTLGEVLVRVGTGKRSELRVGVPSYLRVREGGALVSGLDDAFLGGKLVLREGEGREPQIALLAGSTLPTGSRRVAERKYQPKAILAASIDLSDKASLSSNLGAARMSVDGARFNSFFGSLSLGYSLSEKWGSYVEVYGFSRVERGGRSQEYFNSGLTYLVDNDLQLDARLGWSLNGGDKRAKFFGLGVAHRF